MKKRWMIAAAAAAAAAGTYLYFLPPVKKTNRQSYPFALLLGCPSHKDGTMSSSQIKRCNLAIEAYLKGEFKALVISGGAVKNKYVESVQMKDYIHQIVPEMPIFCEMRARNTWENFACAKEIIADSPVLILCSSLHAKRSNAIARQFFKTYGVETYPDRRLKHILREIPSRMIYIRLEAAKKFRKLCGQ